MISSPHDNRAGVAIAFTALLLTGATALALEISWIRKASYVFGSTYHAMATVLAVFLAGLAAGNYLFGRWSRRIVRPIVVYSVIQISIGLIAALSPGLFLWIDGIYGQFHRIGGGWILVLTVVRFGLIAMVLLPPAVLMGSALPLFSRAFLSARAISKGAGTVYGISTLGGLVGCLAAGFWVIPRIGFNKTIYLSSGIDVVIGVVVLSSWWGRPPLHGARRVSIDSKRVDLGEEQGRRPLVYMLFFVIGFVALANEVLWTRYLSLIVSNSINTYTLVIAVTLAGIGLGSLLVSRPFDTIRRGALLFGSLQIAGALIALLVLFSIPRLWSETFLVPPRGPVLLLFGAVFLPPALLAGASFPLAVRLAFSHHSFAAGTVGALAGINTFGGILGSLAAGFLMIPAVGLQASVMFTAALAIGTGCAAWFLLAGNVPILMRVVAAGAAILAWFAIPPIFETRFPEDLLAPPERLVEFEEGIQSNLAVLQSPDEISLEIDRLWQGSNRQDTQSMAAHVPALLHPFPRRVAGIGIGTGQTFRRFLMYPEVESVTCVDVEPGLIELIENHFNADWLHDGRTHVVIDDGRSFIRHGTDRFDIISLELGQTFRPGVASFYTDDFYREAEQRLNDGGLLVQFLPTEILGMEQFRGVIATFLETFPTSVLWYNRSELLLIGKSGSEFMIDAKRIEAANQFPVIGNDLEFAYWGGPREWVRDLEAFLSGFLMGPEPLAKLSEGAEIYRDDLPSLEYQLSRLSRNRDSSIGEFAARFLEPVSRRVRPALAPLAEARIERIQRLNAGDIVATFHLDRAEEAMSRGGGEEAESHLIMAEAWNPENIKILNNRGLLQAGAGDSIGAESYFRRALQTSPDFMEAHINLGSLLFGSGAPEEALFHFGEVIRLEPQEPDGWLRTAMVLEALGRRESALAAYRKTLELAPAEASAIDGLTRMGAR